MKYMVYLCVCIPSLLAAGEHNSFRGMPPKEIAKHITESNPDTEEQRIHNANLFVAVARGQKDVVESLLERKANHACKIDTDEEGYITPIHVARVHKCEEIVRILEKANASREQE